MDERILELATALGLDVKALTQALASKATIVALTQAQYDELPTKDPATLYVITA